MARVFVVQEPLKKEHGVVVPRINYRTLTPYGDLVFLFQWGELQDDDALENTAPLIWKLRAALKDFRDDDYLVPLGNPALIGMAIAIASECNDGLVNILDWIRDERRYRLITMDLNCQPLS
jgi:hypothetical protein